MSQRKINSKYTLRSVESKNKGTLLDAKIDETDEMKLKILAQANSDSPEDVLYPAELNSHFIEQIKVLSSENTELRKCLFGKDQELKEQSKTITTLKQQIRDLISGSGPAISTKSAGVVSAKIAELCKLNRHLVAEVECYKTKNATLERKILQSELYNKDNENLQACSCKVDIINVVQVKPDELKDLKDKLVTVNKKLLESKNKNTELKNEILQANKVLVNELGDKFTSIKDLQCDPAGFKGRAQQILLLNDKITLLEEKLNIKSKNVNLADERRREQHNQVIRDLEIKKKNEIDRAIQECERKKAENLELRKKLDGTRARIRILECDITTLKQNMQTFTDKSTNDDVLVAEQRKQIKSLELYYQEILHDSSFKMDKLRIAYEDAQKEIKSFEQKIDAMRCLTADKITKIDELKRQLLRYEESSLQSVFFTPMRTASDNEIMILTDLIKNLNKRLSTERQKLDELEDANRKLLENRKRMTRKLHLLEAEVTAFKNSKTKMMSRTSIIKDNSAARNVMSAISVCSKNSILVNNEAKNVTPKLSEDCFCNLEKEDLKNKLELAEEKLRIMDDKLRMLEEEKTEDIEHLTGMIQTSKQLFNDALGVLKKEKCVCRDGNSL